jgi:type II secretory ATPase GspE/PulE/Tfp pilus assembly ATPase PilB-like protein
MFGPGRRTPKSHSTAMVSPKTNTKPHSSRSYRIELEQELAHGGGLSIIRLVDLLIEQASAARASDIHLDPSPDGLHVRLRIDGVLQHVYTLPAAIHPEIISRIKILCSMRTDEHQAAQDGRFKMALPDGKSVDVRTSIVPTYYGENGVLRLLADQAEEFTLDSLGFTAEHKDKIERAMRKPHGMILATGPTGSGKDHDALYPCENVEHSRGVDYHH